jgi:hypothetical protein
VFESVDSNVLAQDSIQCWTVVNTVVKFWVPYKARNLLTS